MTKPDFLLYGANGYTGQLIARMSAQYGLRPLLAGRNKQAISSLANELQLPWVAFDLKDAAALDAALQQVAVVVHAAGPFAFTADAMLEGCLRTGTHYTDINGDVRVFEHIREQYGPAAKQAGIMLLPGAGFDVVPTDCAALWARQLLPDATSLRIAFAGAGGGGISHGTATTMATKLGTGALVRRDGKIVATPLGHKTMTVPFMDKPRHVMTLGWGDVSTAFISTGIGNIETYTAIKPKVSSILRWQWAFNWLLRTAPVRRYVQGKINKRPAGPTDVQRQAGRSMIWVQATNDAGTSCTIRLQTPEGYTLTSMATLRIVQHMLAGKITAGYQTPATAYGTSLLQEIPGIVADEPLWEEQTL